MAVLQRIIVNRSSEVRELYWRATPEDTYAVIGDHGELTLPDGAKVEFGGYFNSLFEFQWRAYTRVSEIALRVRLSGTAILRLWRESAASGRSLLWEGMVAGGTANVVVPSPGGNPRAAGRVFFELTAQDGPATLRDAVYVALGQAAAPVGLVLVFCTFNRERDLAACLERIAADTELVGELAEIVVVNQGRPGLAEPPALRGTLRIVEQGNFGGAGGFTRGLLEALDNCSATHVCFVDDDVRIEPESLFRMITFFRMARADLALGGHMLDGIRANVLYEAGGVVDRASWQLRPLHAGGDLRDPAVLDRLVDFTPMDYNGWWLFGFPLAFARRLGLPLPCFIRGDDVEYGLRLHAAGLTTVGLPGIAVWHEPFYVKIGGWQLYYEVRNQLIAASLHLGFSRRHVAGVMLKHLLIYLLTFRYFSAALIVRGMRDFLRGPALLHEAPGPLHASLSTLKARFPETTMPRTRVVPPAQVATSPRWKLGFYAAMARILLRDLVRPTRPAAPARRIDVGDLVWFRLEHAERIVVDTYWDAEMPVFARSREYFRAVAGEATRVFADLFRNGERVAAQWRAATPELTSEAHWRGYLGLDAVNDVPVALRTREAAD